MPPPIIGDLTHGTFTNSETLIRFFAQSTLTGWCRKIEAEFHRSCFSDAARLDHQFVLDMSGLLRGDPETRWKSHEIALRNRVLTPNEVRGEEGWNPRPGGDEFPQPAAPANPKLCGGVTWPVKNYRTIWHIRREHFALIGQLHTLEWHIEIS